MSKCLVCGRVLGHENLQYVKGKGFVCEDCSSGASLYERMKEKRVLELERDDLVDKINERDKKRLYI